MSVPPSSPWGQSRRSGLAPVFGALRTLGLTAAAYLAAAAAYGMIVTLTSIPQGDAWNQALKLPCFFVLMIVAMVALLVPLFRSDTDASSKQFSLFSATLFVAYSVMTALHLGEPDAPLKLIVTYLLEPLRGWILH
jgi:hypothetical protein